MQLRLCRWSAAWLACLGLVFPLAPAHAQSPSTLANKEKLAADGTAIRDVALRDTGALYGIVVDAQGLPMPGTEVTVSQSGSVVARAKTDALGQFNTTPLRGGVYQVVAGQGGATLRAWEAKAAPPSARPVALVVGSPEVVRGQIPFRKAFFSDALVLTAIIAAAIAIPVAISSARNPQPSSS